VFTNSAAKAQGPRSGWAHSRRSASPASGPVRSRAGRHRGRPARARRGARPLRVGGVRQARADPACGHGVV